MEEIKVNEYVRINLGIIGKFIWIEYDEVDKHLKWYVLDKGVFDLSYTNKPYIKKHSPNIIDLIEIGDYVNGLLILDIENMGDSTKKAFTTYKYNEHSYIRVWGKEDIKTILTKEQYKANCY